MIAVVGVVVCIQTLIASSASGSKVRRCRRRGFRKKNVCEDLRRAKKCKNKQDVRTRFNLQNQTKIDSWFPFPVFECRSIKMCAYGATLDYQPPTVELGLLLPLTTKAKRIYSF